MDYGVLGTGMVGQAIATKLIALGHDAKLGSRAAGNEKAVAWVATAGALASEGSFADAAAFGEVVFNCTSGTGALAALGSRLGESARQGARGRRQPARFLSRDAAEPVGLQHR